MSVPVEGPSAIDRTIAGVRASRDLVLIAIGVIVMRNALPSLEDFGFSTPASRMWAALILGGAAAALVGSLRRAWLLLEIWGCVSVCAGLAIWSLGLVLRPGDTSSASWAVSLAVLGLIHGEVVRILDSIGERKATR